VVKDYVQTVMLAASGPGVVRQLAARFAGLERRARSVLRREGFLPAEQRFERALDLRYRGQAYELTVPFTPNFARAFHRAHERRYGYADPARPLEIVNVRLRALGLTDKPVLKRQRFAGRSPRAARYRRVPVYFNSRTWPTDFYVRERLRAGNRLRGPAVIAEYSATTVLPPGWRARVDAHENLVLEPRR
jgi:N-methylhydantoinase A